MSKPVFELLQAYLRAANTDYGDNEPPIDIKEIMKVVQKGSGDKDA